MRRYRAALMGSTSAGSSRSAGRNSICAPKWKLLEVIGEDLVAAEVEFTGTNSGPLAMGGMEIPATGRSVVGRGAYFARVKDGKVVEFSAHPDAAGMILQLRLMQRG